MKKEKKAGQRRVPKDWTFLIVDDDAQVRYVLEDYLKSFGYKNILTAANGMQALATIKNSTQRLDFIISDWQMPKMNGLNFLYKFRQLKNRKHVKFLLVTSETSMEEMKVKRAALYKVDGYIIKPFKAQTLRDKIDEIINAPTNPSRLKIKNKKRITPEKPIKETTAEEAEILGSLFTSLTGNKPLGKVTLKDNEDVDSGSVYVHSNILSMLKFAKIHRSRDWFEKPIALFQEANRLFPENALILFYLAVSYYFGDKMEEAVQNLNKVLELSPGHSDAIFYLNEINNKKSA